MKAILKNGIAIEGTAEEMAKLLSLPIAKNGNGNGNGEHHEVRHYTKRIKSSAIRHPNLFKTWTTDEEERLMTLKSQDLPGREIARQLGRTRKGIEQRISLIRQRGKLHPAGNRSER